MKPRKKRVVAALGVIAISGFSLMFVSAVNNTKEIKPDITNAVQTIGAILFKEDGKLGKVTLTNIGSLIRIDTEGNSFLLSNDNNSSATGLNSTILGGTLNKIEGNNPNTSTIIGGRSNRVESASNAVIGGGETNTVVGDYGTVAGGYGNQAIGAASTVVGGNNNAAGGKNSVVLGSNSAADGSDSVALGNNSKVSSIVAGSFLWSDSNDTELRESNTFAVVAGSGMVVNTTKAHRFAQLTVGGSLVVNRSESDLVECSSETKGVLKVMNHTSIGTNQVCFCSCDGNEWNSLFGAGNCNGICKNDEVKPACDNSGATIYCQGNKRYYSGACLTGEVVEGIGAYMVDRNDYLHWTCQTDDGAWEACAQSLSDIVVPSECSPLLGEYNCGGVYPEGEGVLTGVSTYNGEYNADIQWRYTSSAVLGACEWSCKSGYHKEGDGCDGNRGCDANPSYSGYNVPALAYHQTLVVNKTVTAGLTVTSCSGSVFCDNGDIILTENGCTSITSCAATGMDGYNIPALNHLVSTGVSKTENNGLTVTSCTGTATCNNGVVSVAGEVCTSITSCVATGMNGYNIPALNHLASTGVSKTENNGLTVTSCTGTATCNNGVVSVAGEVCTSITSCVATGMNGYNIPALNHGATGEVIKSVVGGSCTAVASCNNGVVSLTEDVCEMMSNCVATGMNGYNIPALNHGVSTGVYRKYMASSRTYRCTNTATCNNGTVSLGTESCNTFTCRSIPSYAILVTGSDYGLTANTTAVLYASVEAAGTNKCAYVCKPGYVYNNGRCTSAPTYTCGGTKPSGTTKYRFGATSSTTSGLVWTYTSNSDLGACEYTCNTANSYIWTGGDCKQLRACGTKPSGANKYIFGATGTTSDNTTWHHTDNAEPGECEYICNAENGYVRNGSSCITYTTCAGTRPSGEGILTGSSTYPGQTTQKTWTYTSSSNPGACEWTCDAANYERNGNSCRRTTPYTECGGNGPSSRVGVLSGSSTYPGQSTQKTWTYKSSGTLGACEWRCDTANDYEYYNNRCVTWYYCSGIEPSGEGVNPGPGAFTNWRYASDWTYTDDSNPGNCEWTCESGYTWNGGNGCTVYVPVGECQGLPDHATPNNSTVPSVDTQYTYSTNTSAVCTFQCDGGYTWDGGECAVYVPVGECQGLPDHATPNNSTVPSVDTQYTYSTDVSAVCTFQCDSLYMWNDITSKCEMKGTTEGRCTGSVPEHAIVNNDDAPLTDTEYYYNMHTIRPCTFQCDTNYTYDSSENKCKPKTQDVTCGTAPDYSTWVLGTYKKTWNGSSWTPSSKPSNTCVTSSSSTIECSFKCNDGKVCDGNSGCKDPIVPTHACGGTEPGGDGVSKGSSTYTEGNTITSWTYKSGSEPLLSCEWRCDEEHYDRDGTTCKPKTQDVDCGVEPANSSWVAGKDTFRQTWGDNGWTPLSVQKTCVTSSNGAGECSFICDNNYKCNSAGNGCERTSCTGPCGSVRGGESLTCYPDDAVQCPATVEGVTRTCNNGSWNQNFPSGYTRSTPYLLPEECSTFTCSSNPGTIEGGSKSSCDIYTVAGNECKKGATKWKVECDSDHVLSNCSCMPKDDGSCAEGSKTYNGKTYSYSAMSNGGTQSVTANATTTKDGTSVTCTYSATATCTNKTVSISNETETSCSGERDESCGTAPTHSSWVPGRGMFGQTWSNSVWGWVPSSVEWKCEDYASPSDECVFRCDSNNNYICDGNTGCTICACYGPEHIDIYTTPNYLECNNSDTVNGNKNVFNGACTNIVSCVNQSFELGSEESCTYWCEGDKPEGDEYDLGSEVFHSLSQNPTSWRYKSSGTLGACEWRCTYGNHYEDGICTGNTKQVLCDDSGTPDNATPIIGYVEITWNGSSWSSPELCEWVCNKNYHTEDNVTCTGNTKKVDCDGKPNGSVWVNNQFTQNWNNGWSPSNVIPTYSSNSLVECSYLCDTNNRYFYVNKNCTYRRNFCTDTKYECLAPASSTPTGGDNTKDTWDCEVDGVGVVDSCYKCKYLVAYNGDCCAENEIVDENGQCAVDDPCADYKLSSCPSHGACSSCPSDSSKKKLDSCQPNSLLQYCSTCPSTDWLGACPANANCMRGDLYRISDDGNSCVIFHTSYRFLGCKSGYVVQDESHPYSCVLESDPCEDYPLTSCPDFGQCANCPSNSSRKKLVDCHPNWANMGGYTTDRRGDLCPDHTICSPNGMTIYTPNFNTNKCNASGPRYKVVGCENVCGSEFTELSCPDHSACASCVGYSRPFGNGPYCETTTLYAVKTSCVEGLQNSCLGGSTEVISKYYSDGIYYWTCSNEGYSVNCGCRYWNGNNYCTLIDI